MVSRVNLIKKRGSKMKEKLIWFLRRIWRQSHIVLSFAVLGIAVMSWQAWRKPPIYKASQTLTISPLKLESQNRDSWENDVAVRLYSHIEENEEASLKTLIEKNNLFNEERADGQSIDVLVEKLLRRIEVTNLITDQDSVTVLDLSYISVNREEAEAVTSALVTQLIDSQTDEQNQIRVLSSCCQQTNVVAPKRLLMITFGLFAGLFVGVLFAAMIGKKEDTSKK